MSARERRYPDCTRFGEIAIDDVVHRILTAPEGQQEITIRCESFRIGCLLGDRDISQERARRTVDFLTGKIRDRGVPWDRAELRRKIERAVDQGQAKAKGNPHGR
jgi:hypothetical protein